MAVPKGSKLTYWDALDASGKADKFFEHAERDPENTREARSDKEYPCKICNKKVKAGQQYYPSNNLKVIAHQSCVDDNRTLQPEERGRRYADRVREISGSYQSATPGQKSASIVAQAFELDDDRSEEAVSIMANLNNSGNINSAFNKLIWRLGMERLTQLMAEGANLTDLLRLK